VKATGTFLNAPGSDMFGAPGGNFLALSKCHFEPAISDWRAAVSLRLGSKGRYAFGPVRLTGLHHRSTALKARYLDFKFFWRR